eukprot:4388504-Pleurochrysis_carterae.AAC.1
MSELRAAEARKRHGSGCRLWMTRQAGCVAWKEHGGASTRFGVFGAWQRKRGGAPRRFGGFSARQMEHGEASA